MFAAALFSLKPWLSLPIINEIHVYHGLEKYHSSLIPNQTFRQLCPADLHPTTILYEM
jgi:hypothetical protein